MPTRTVVRWIAIICALALALAPPAFAQGRSLPEMLAAYMEPYTRMGDFSGRILVARGDSILVDSAFTAVGDMPSTPSTRFGIGSLTKTFTAAAIRVLEAQGKLRLSDTVGLFIPGFPSGGKVTIAQLLTHTSGVPDYYTQPDYPIVSMLLGRSYTAPSIRPTKTLTDSIARRYVGRYQIAPGFVLSVRQSPGGLELAGPEGDFMPLDTQSDSTFFYRPLYVHVSFVRDSTGWNTMDWNGQFRGTRVTASSEKR